MSEDANNLIVFRPDSDYPITKRERRGCRCREARHEFPNGSCPPVFIDEHTRALECKLCGAIIDPFDYCWHLATEGLSLRRDLIHMREERAALKAQISLLHDELKEIRSVNRKAQRA